MQSLSDFCYGALQTQHYHYQLKSSLPGQVQFLTWLQAKKHNELNSSYSLAAHEIVLIKSEAELVDSDKALSNFVVSSESAFSREHTQWTARKNV